MTDQNHPLESAIDQNGCLKVHLNPMSGGDNP